jgi:hypothetical protein
VNYFLSTCPETGRDLVVPILDLGRPRGGWVANDRSHVPCEDLSPVHGHGHANHEGSGNGVGQHSLGALAG